MKVILWIWQIIQNIIGLVLIIVTSAERKNKTVDSVEYTFWVSKRFNSNWAGVSLGDYVVFAAEDYADEKSIKHEHGHQIQSVYTGPLYLLLVGIPSFVRNIYDRIAHKDWTYIQRVNWYYGGWPENSADKLGGVKRLSL